MHSMPSVVATWSAADGWLLTHPTQLPPHAVLQARQWIYRKRVGGLAALPPGPMRDELKQALNDLRTASRVRFAVVAQNGGVAAFQSTEKMTATTYSIPGDDRG